MRPLAKKIKEAILQIIMEENPTPQDGIEALYEAALTITMCTGEALGEDRVAFSKDILQQTISILDNN